MCSIIHDQSLVIRASYTESSIFLNTSQYKSTGKQTTHAAITRLLEYMHTLLSSSEFSTNITYHASVRNHRKSWSSKHVTPVHR
jgi:hypothetical protein